MGDSEFDDDILGGGEMEENDYNEEHFLVGNATENFLRYLQYPENEHSLIDLQQVAVAIMAHLDRLCKPHQKILSSQEETRTKDSSSAVTYSFEKLQYFGKCGTTGNFKDVRPLLSQNDVHRNQMFQQVVSLNGAVVGLTDENHVWWCNFDNVSKSFSKVHFSQIYQISSLITNVEGNVLLGADDKNNIVYFWNFPSISSYGIDLSQYEPAEIHCDQKLDKIATSSDHFIGSTENSEIIVWKRTTRNSDHQGEDFVPTRINQISLSGETIENVSCGGTIKDGTSFYFVLTTSGKVFSWGDNKLGNLGRQQSEEFDAPKIVDKLQGMHVTEIHCGDQFCLAVCGNGTVYTWGKSDQYRLGYGTSDEYIPYPKNVEALLGRRVIKACVGASHVVVLTDDNKVLGWGSNEHYQFGSHLPKLLRVPTALDISSVENFGGLTTGLSFTLFWSKSMPSLEKCQNVAKEIPFVLDICEDTFSLIDQLLNEVWDDALSGERNWPPRQEQECIAISCINLLKLQIHSYLLLEKSKEPRESDKNSNLEISKLLLTSIKQKVVDLASNRGVLKTIQIAAQSCLKIGWSVLLPTAEERARALSALLPTEIQAFNVSSTGDTPRHIDRDENCSGKRFMIDLLVNSLIQKDSLETALMTAIKVEMQEIDQKRLEKASSSEKTNSGNEDKPVDGRDGLLSAQAQLERESKRTLEAIDASMLRSKAGENGSSIPLLHLIKQLMRNAGSESLLKLNHIATSTANNVELNDYLSNEGSNVNQNEVQTKLLLKFQRLLFSYMYHFSKTSPICEETESYEGDLPGVLALLCKYINLLSCHINELLPVASSI